LPHLTLGVMRRQSEWLSGPSTGIFYIVLNDCEAPLAWPTNPLHQNAY
jgi:hypothetical protein